MPELNELRELVQKQASIVAVISTYLNLHNSRKSLKGPCPFHQDNTTSLMVSPEKNIFKCFGCGNEGGPVEFLSRIGGIGEDEAVSLLAGWLNTPKN